MPENPLFRAGGLVDCRVSCWRGRKALQERDLGLQETPPDIFRLGSKYLIPREVVKKFLAIDGSLGYILRAWSFPFPLGHSRFVTYPALPVVVPKLQEQEKAFWKLVTRFFARYDEYRDQMLKQYSQWRESLENEYPSAA